MLHTLQTKDSYHCFDFDILTSSRNPNTNVGRFHGILRDFENEKFIFLFVHVSFFGGGGGVRSFDFTLFQLVSFTICTLSIKKSITVF